MAGISKEYGRLAGVVEGQEFYSFPKLEELLRITEDDFRSLKTGFRAPYLCDAILHLNEWGEMESFADLPYEEAKNKLMTIKGVGDKVANCVLLFGFFIKTSSPPQPSFVSSEVRNLLLIHRNLSYLHHQILKQAEVYHY